MTFARISLSAICSLVSFLSIAVRAEYVVHEQRSETLGGDVIRSRVHADTLLPIRIALKPNEHASSSAEAWLMAVSDPDSPSFGQFWHHDDVVEAFKPADDTINLVNDWLLSQGIEATTFSDNKQWLAFDLPTRQAEALLKTRYFGTVSANGGIEVSCDSYMLPEKLQSHVDFVKP